MVKLLKFFHTFASCGFIGGLLAYMLLLAKATQGSAVSYAHLRFNISLLCNYVLIPSLAVVLVSGLLSMAAHRPFQEKRWVWIKALLGLSLFESTLAIVQSKAEYASKISAKIVEGQAQTDALSVALATEWYSLGAIFFISIANIILGVWRPSLKKRNYDMRKG